jgi:hypothetical protein
MVEHFKKTNTPYHTVRIIPFVHEIEGKVPEVDGPVVVYGSIGSQKLAHKQGWTPGIFGDPKVFSESNAERNLGPLYLNWGQFKSKIKQFGENLDAWSHLMVPLGEEPATEFFIKPNTDTKEFAGTVMSFEEFKPWYENMLSIGYLEENDFWIVFSRPKKLACEWRVVVVDGKISSSSLYRQYGIVKAERHIIPEVEAVVMEAHELYQPAPVYVIDIAQWGDTYKVIEYNTFNSAGLYDCDVAKIIDDINSYVDSTFVLA